MEDRVLDWQVYEDTARKMVTEGMVLLKNDNNTLPLKKDETVSVFGRMQNYYYKSGTGSGGMVNVSRVVGIMDALWREKILRLIKIWLMCMYNGVRNIRLILDLDGARNHGHRRKCR